MVGRIVLVYGSLVVYEVHIYNRIRRPYSRIQVVSGIRGHIVVYGATIVVDRVV